MNSLEVKPMVPQE